MPFVLPAIAAIGTAVASAATAVAVGVETLALAAGVSGAAALTIGSAVEAAIPFALQAGGLLAFSALTAPKPKVNTAGSPQTYKADPQAPIPFVMARYGVGGNLIYQTTSGGASKAEHGAAGNEFLTDFIVLSGMGPLTLESTRLDDTVLTFSGQNCTGGYIEQANVQAYNPGYTQNPNGSYANNNYKDHYWQYFQGGDPFAHGQMSYPAKINNPNDYLPEWDDAHRLSGFAAVSCTRSYDTTVWTGGVGQPQWVVGQGYPVYDPRRDSSVPGGSGPQRWPGRPGDRRDYYQAARGTWAPSDNPIIHALNYAMGFFLPDPATGSGAADINSGRRYAGVGAGPDGVDVAAFMHAAAVADANGWKITGQWTSQDGKRSVLTAMLQAGGAKLASDRGRISCVVSEPLVAANAGAPLTWADLAGAPQVDTTVGVRDRFNTVFYKYTSEAHRWQVVQADTPVKAATYVAEDGGVVRSTTLELPYVPSVNQAAQLAAYAAVDGREIPNIVLPGKPHLRGYGPGDCLVVDLPEIGLHLTKLVVLKRQHDPATGFVTLTCRSETDAKHDYALGRTGVAPPTPSISGFDPTIVPAPLPGNWTAGGVAVSDPITGEVVHVIRINGTTIDNVYAAQVVVLYRQVVSVNGADTEPGDPAAQSFSASETQIDLNLPAGRWHLWLRYVTISGAENVENTLDLGIITVGGSTAAVAASVTVDTVIADRDKVVGDILADIAAAQAGLDSIAAADYDDAIAGLNAAISGPGGLDAQFSTLNGQFGTLNTRVTDPSTGLIQQVQGIQSQAFGSGSSSLISRLGVVETASTNLSKNKADASRATALEATVNGANGQPGLSSRVTSLEQASASGGQYATASSVQQLEAVINGNDTTTGDAVGLAGRITNVLYTKVDIPGGVASTTAVQSLTAQVLAPNPNLIPDSTFALAISGAPSGAWNTSSVAVQASGRGNRLITTGSGGYATSSPTFPVDPGTIYTLSARQSLLSTGGSFALRVVWLKSDRSTVSAISAPTPTPQDAGSPGALQSVTVTSPSDAAFAYVQWGGSSPGAGAHQLYQPKLEAGPTVTAFVPDGVTATSLVASIKVTQTAVAQHSGYLAAGYTLAVTAGNQVASMSLLATDGTTRSLSSVLFKSNFFGVVGPSGATMAFTDNSDGSGTFSVDKLVVKYANIGIAQVGTLQLGSGSVTGLGYANGLSAFTLGNSAGGSSPPTATGSTGGGSTGTTPPRGGGHYATP